jgi:steroid delta-isomerase-like uncharacterized protein
MDNQGVILRLFAEVLNRGNLDILDELIGEPYTDHNPVPGQLPGAAGVRVKLQALRRAFPDIRFVLEDLVAAGATVAVRYYWEGTQQGEFLGRPASGKAVHVHGMDFYRLRHGQIIEHWDNVDELGLLRQLGIVNP